MHEASPTPHPSLVSHTPSPSNSPMLSQAKEKEKEKEVLSSMPILPPSASRAVTIPNLNSPSPIPSSSSSSAPPILARPSVTNDLLSLFRFVDTKNVTTRLAISWISKIKGTPDVRFIQSVMNEALDELKTNNVIRFHPDNLSFKVLTHPANFEPVGSDVITIESKFEVEHLRGLVEVLKEKMSVFEFHKTHTWKGIKDFLPHVLHLSRLNLRFPSPSDLATTFYHSGEYLRQACQDYDQAHHFYQLAFEIRFSLNGEQNHQTAVALGAIGKVKMAREQLSLSREICEKVLLCEEMVASHRNSPRVARILLDLGMVTLAQGSVSEAILFLERGFNMRKALHGSETEECVEIALELANAYLASGTVDRARGMLDLCQGSLIKLGNLDNHHLGAQLFFQLGRTCIAAKNPRDAAKYVEKSRDIRNRLYQTEDHPEVFTAYEALSTIALDQGDQAGALAYAQVAMKIADKIFDMQQQAGVARVLYVMARADAKQYAFSAARNHLKRALEVLRRLYQTEETSFYVILLREYGFALFNEGNYKQGAEAFEKVIRLNCKLTNTDQYPGVASDLYDLGRCLTLSSELTEAVMILQQGLVVQHLDQPSMSKMLQELGWIHMAKEVGTESFAWFKRCLLSDTQSRAKDEALMATMFHELGRSYYEEGKFSEAISHFEQSLEMSRRYHGTESHPNYATTLGCLAQVYFDQGKTELGKTHLEKAFVTCQKTLGDTHPTTVFFQTKLLQAA